MGSQGQPLLTVTEKIRRQKMIKKYIKNLKN